MAVHDGEVREPVVELRTVLALTRRAAGRRGHSQVAWHGAGFTYVLDVVRDPGANPAVVEVDADVDGDWLDDRDPGPQLAHILGVYP